ncbi:hypothetical protein, partial [Rikenella microfusus]|uniref:hypothetical protein n=1 Tax=Rikenella microfusus TaxID=28139 RepID=UPI00248E3539
TSQPDNRYLYYTAILQGTSYRSAASPYPADLTALSVETDCKDMSKFQFRKTFSDFLFSDFTVSFGNPQRRC